MKANEKISTEKIIEMEEVFNKIKIDNENLVKKIPLLKNKQISISKDLEAYSFNRKFPHKVYKYYTLIQLITIYNLSIYLNQLLPFSGQPLN